MKNVLSLEERLLLEEEKSKRLEDLLDLKLKEILSLNDQLTSMNNSLEALVFERTMELESTIEKLKKSSQAKSQFLANISHELRTPINSISGFSSLLAAKEIDADTKVWLERIGEASHHLVQHIKNIIEFSSLDKSDDLQIKKPFSSSQVLQLIDQQFARQAEKKGLQFCVSRSLPKSARFLGDEASILRILQVLVENAIKYSEQGQVEINESGELHPITQGFVIRYDVVDSGPGFTEDQLADIFTPFSQADNSDQRSHGGLGLGLSIASRLAQRMGAEIRVQSQPGRGSQFSLWYPVEKTAQAPVVKTSPDEAQAKIKELSPQLKILAVDDNDSNLLLLLMTLKKLGFKADTAKNGQEAVDKINDNQSYDLILMDCQMPIMDGLEATQCLRRKGFSNPIVAVTANARDENMKQCLDIGMNAFLTKPFSIGELTEAMVQTLHPLHGSQRQTG